MKFKPPHYTMKAYILTALIVLAASPAHAQLAPDLAKA